jgi:hypothetical protein
MASDRPVCARSQATAASRAMRDVRVLVNVSTLSLPSSLPTVSAAPPSSSKLWASSTNLLFVAITAVAAPWSCATSNMLAT